MKVLLTLIGPIMAALAQVPDPKTTPGVVNPNVTQDNIQQTICKSGWSATVRPPDSYTQKIKINLMKQLNLQGNIGDYELDHKVAIEAGGSPTDPQNLWMQKWAGPWNAHMKDKLENAVHRSICSGKITLAAGQEMLTRDWTDGYVYFFGAPTGVSLK